eukprot:scaffold36556_cov208-Isochrysis_galbana.AAC.2
MDVQFVPSCSRCRCAPRAAGPATEPEAGTLYHAPVKSYVQCNPCARCGSRQVGSRFAHPHAQAGRGEVPRTCNERGAASRSHQPIRRFGGDDRTRRGSGGLSDLPT